MTTLPIESALPAVRDALATYRGLVIQAPPGAGKTTLVPLALLDERWLGGRTIIVLEPRRLATRAAAHRMAHLRGEAVGETIGYRMRGDARVGRATRVEVVTEGILTRRLQHDPTLDGVGAIIFDEIHERSVDADLGLALALRTRELIRDDLRLIGMSATLDSDAVARLLDDAPIVSSAGRAFPVETRYVPPRPGVHLDASVAAVVVDAVRRDAGDVLVFLPGASEIRRVERLLADRDIADALVLPLFGTMSQEAQDRAIWPDPGGRRKVVIATSIAETSLTIEGVRIVVDAGLSRVPRFSPRTGMSRLETVRVSRASADQRRGRAGRVSAGVCYRLWPEYENAHLLQVSPPEILNADLAPLALELAAAGVSDPAELRWLDAPPKAAFAHARELLRELGAVDDAGIVTAAGREMNALPVHPRLAHMIRHARARHATSLACDVAALLSERDVFRSTGARIDSDMSRRIDVLRGDANAVPADAEVDRDALRRVRAESERLRRQLRIGDEGPSEQKRMLGQLLALAYPDRVAQRRPGSRARFLLRNGTGAELVPGDGLAASPCIVAAELDEQRPESRVFLAAAISVDEIRDLFAAQIEREDVIEFDDVSAAVVARRRERLGAIVLRETSLHAPNADDIRRAMLQAIRRRGIASLPWSDASVRFRERLAFMAHHDPTWPDVTDERLAATLDVWLAPNLDGVTRWIHLTRVDLAAALGSLLDWKQRRALDELAPTHVTLPSGARAAIDYSDPEAPVLAARIQAAFGMSESPRILGGRVPLTMRLLSPANRPVQTTRDLAGFWRTSYREVRKDMRGRYPKHDWPEDPTAR